MLRRGYVVDLEESLACVWSFLAGWVYVTQEAATPRAPLDSLGKRAVGAKLAGVETLSLQSSMFAAVALLPVYS